jgi:hypothetical protein
MAAIIHRAGRKFNVDEADGVSRRDRVIGSIRRECLDHFLILSEAHLRRLLHAYGAYYNTTRPHQSLDNNSPQPRVAEPPPGGRIIAIPQVGGLHRRYQRAA